MTGGTLEETSHISRSHIGNVARYDVLRELSDTDKWKGEGNGGEVIDTGSWNGSVEPSNHVETMLVVGMPLDVCLLGQRQEYIGGDLGEEGFHKWSVDVIQVL